MIKSMTGFGRGEVVISNKKIIVEIKSLNSKQLDLNLKSPAVFRQYESDIRTIATKQIARGKTDIYVNIESSTKQTAVQINRDVFNAYYDELIDICKDKGVEDTTNIVQTILRFPDVMSAPVETISEPEHHALMEATQLAVDNLNAFRLQEGAILIADLFARVDKIESYKDAVVPFEQARVDTIKNRILDNLEKIKINVDHSRLEQEMIYYMEKLDITEEKVRLTNHCNYFRDVARQEEGVGRKLGFIAQEMGREINTMGSKSNEPNMQILVVQMKDELEKIKEQLLNIL